MSRPFWTIREAGAAERGCDRPRRPHSCPSSRRETYGSERASVVDLGLGTSEPEEKDAARSRQARPERKLTEVRVERDEEAELGTRPVQHDHVCRARLVFLDPGDVMTTLAQGPHDGSGEVLVGEDPHHPLSRPGMA
jgi:hypothetical protein